MIVTHRIAASCFTSCLLLATALVPVAATETKLVSITSNRTQGNGASFANSITPDGRFITFDSNASNLTPNDTNALTDGFVRDLVNGTTERVTVGRRGVQLSAGSVGPISAGGRYVTFRALGQEVLPGNTNPFTDVFVHDRQTGLNELVTVGSNGANSDSDTNDWDMTPDARFIAFISFATTLVPPNRNPFGVYLRDRKTQRTERINRSVTGSPVDGASFEVAISANGRFVAYVSEATNLVRNDTNFARDIFLYDRTSRTTRRVSVGVGNAELADSSDGPSLSADGRYLAFRSFANDVVPGIADGGSNIYLRDLLKQRNILVSVTIDGMPQDDFSFRPSLSPDGSCVAFRSRSTNLVPGDTNGTQDVFVRDLVAGVTRRVSVGPSGLQGNGDSGDFFAVPVSRGCRSVAFTSSATNLVAQDNNANKDVFVRAPR